MNITKYEHACLVVEELGQRLVIDPGMFAVSLPMDVSEVVAIVITHEHGDHMDLERLRAILEVNPDATIFAPRDVLTHLTEIEAKKEVAEPDVSHTAGSFALDFYGKDHAIIYEKVPCQNVGVFVNKTLYYPGDSFTEPKKEVKLLALPNGAPWMKIGEAMQFMKKVMPRAVFPTHNALYSEAGTMFANNWLEQEATALGAPWRVREPGDSIEV